MRKMIAVFCMAFILIFTTSCSFLERENFHTYGVIINESINSNSEEQLIFNSVDFGYMVIPSSDKIYLAETDEVVKSYDYQIGDLIEVYYNDSKDVIVQESYPSKFGEEPDSIRVWKEDTYLIESDGEYIFKFPIDSVCYEYDFEILNKNIGDLITVRYTKITEGIPEEVRLCDVEIKEINSYYVEIKVSELMIKDLLMYYSEDLLSLFEYDDTYEK